MKTNPAVIHRVKFETNKVTIYSANGILATWKGKPAAKFRAAVAHAMDWIEEKMDGERADLPPLPPPVTPLRCARCGLVFHDDATCAFEREVEGAAV